MSKARCVFISLLISTTFGGGAWAQSQSSTPVATGKVVGASGAAAVGAPLQVVGPQGKTVVYTDARGQWSLYNLPAGTYSVTPLGKTPAAHQPVEFSIKDKGLVDKVFGSGEGRTFFAPEIKLNN